MKQGKVLVFTTIVVAGCLLLQFLPTYTISEDVETTKLDLLSDIRKSVPVTPVDTIAEIVDSCSTAFILKNEYLRDYSTSNDSASLKRGMSLFYKKLFMADSLDRPVRIAYFGDSFIEGDILTEDLRALLQDKFGGSGVGYVYVDYKISNHRNSVHSEASSWTSYCIINKKKDYDLLGVDGMYFRARGTTAYVHLTGIPEMADKHQDKGNMSAIYYRPDKGIRLKAEIDGKEVTVKDSVIGHSVAMKRIHGTMKDVKWIVNSLPSAPAVVYGTTMETDHGICLDNFGIRSSTGLEIVNQNDSIFKDFLKERQYDLIIFGYGLNIVSKKSGVNYSPYINILEQGVRKFARYAPEAAIMLVSVGDMARRTGRGLESCVSSEEYASQQRLMAHRLGCCFWDLRKTMLSLGGIIEMASQKPIQAEKDYQHITFEGGKVLAKRLYNDIVDGYNQYDNYIKNEKRKIDQNNTSK